MFAITRPLDSAVWSVYHCLSNSNSNAMIDWSIATPLKLNFNWSIPLSANLRQGHLTSYLILIIRPDLNLTAQLFMLDAGGCRASCGDTPDKDVNWGRQQDIALNTRHSLRDVTRHVSGHVSRGVTIDVYLIIIMKEFGENYWKPFKCNQHVNMNHRHLLNNLSVFWFVLLSLENADSNYILLSNTS